MTPEGIVVEEVVRYFSDPRFQKFSIKKEYPIQMGSDNRRADVVLLDSAGRLVAIAECKRVGEEGQGLDQLKSYLSATDTRFGIFANSTNPADWDFYENLGRNEVRSMTRSEFEERVVNRENNQSQPDRRTVRSGSAKHFVNKGGTMKIRPTLYVGLGTTGTKILNHLRGLNHQEYGQAGLPIFRYISIETDGSKDGKVSSIDDDRIGIEYDKDGVPIIVESELRPADYEVNHVIHTPIPNPESIHERIDPNSPVYDEHLAGWLDANILDLDAVRRPGGAGNIRMVGRLSLWENWDQGNLVYQRFRGAYDAIWEEGNKQQASTFLKRHFGAEVTVDEENRNVFIVGTLCGGTCSGMLLDIAYYFRQIAREASTINTYVYGLFTMHDEALASGGDSAVLLANCYASLVELDYYKRDATEYRITLPGGTDFRTKNSPFDIATFLSATNMDGERFVDPNGLFVQDELDRMGAADLFVRTLGMDALIDADLVNATAASDHQFEALRNVGDETETGSFVQYMFSSGLEKVWLPKEKIVRLAATEFIKHRRSEWRESQPATSSDSAVLVQDILRDIRRSLNKTVTEPLTPLTNNLDGINSGNYLSEAQRCLTAFITGGERYNLVNGNRLDGLTQAVGILKDAVRSFEGTSQMFPKKVYLTRIEELLQAELKDSKYLDNLGSRDDILRFITEAENSANQKSRFGRNKFNLPGFKGAILQQQEELNTRLINLFVKGILNDLRSEVRKWLQSLEREINEIEPKFNLVIWVFDDPSEIEKQAADDFVSEILQRESSTPSVEELIRILRKTEPGGLHWHIRNELRPAFNGIAPDLMLEFDEEAVRRSRPYQTFTPNYMENYRLRFERSGGEIRLFRYLHTNQHKLEDASSLRSSAQVDSKDFPIRNLRVLYQMEAGYTLDDLGVVERLKTEYDTAMSKYIEHGGFPVHIHKDPDEFNVDAIHRAAEVETLWRAIRELLGLIRESYPGRFGHVLPNGSLNGNSAFPVGELAARIQGKRIASTFIDDNAGHEELARNAEACANFVSATRTEFKNLQEESTSNLIEELPSLSALINEFNARIEDNAARQKSEQFYDELLKFLEK